MWWRKFLCFLSYHKWCVVTESHTYDDYWNIRIHNIFHNGEIFDFTMFKT